MSGFWYEYVRRSGRLVSLPWVVWRVLPRSRRMRVSKTGVSSYSQLALLAPDGPKRSRS